MKRKVLFICRNNYGRSQMAEGILRTMYGDHYEVHSAGSDPKEISPPDHTGHEEIGVDMSGHRPKSLREFEGEKFDIVASLCHEACHVFLGGERYLHAEFPDPRGVQILISSGRSVMKSLSGQIKSSTLKTVIY
ncbi:MAG: arsenate reductase ArsC [Methanothermobacter sp.]|nr:arsenate reductase ArsC [Methanothermobacter sp.]